MPKASKWVLDKAETRSTMPPTGMNVFVGPGLSGVPVTPDTALTLPAAFSCINVLSTDVAMLPLGLYRSIPGGGKRIETGRNIQWLLRRSPNGRTTSMRFRQAQMGHVLGWGNSYCEIVRDSWSGEPRSIHLLSPRPWETWPCIENGQLVYRIDRGRRCLRSEDVLHVAGLGWDGLVGYSPVALAREAFGLGLATEKFGAAFFGNGSHAHGFLKTPKRLDDAARKNIKESFEDEHRGPDNAHRLGLLEEGLDFVKTSIDPEDAQFLLTRAFQVLEICRLYRVPPNKVMDYSEAHLANLEESNTDYSTTSLAPWCQQFEEEYNLKLLSRFDLENGLEIRHDMRGLMRGNTQARATYYDLMMRNSVLSPNQVAQLEDFDPIPGGDVHFAPLNMTTLQSLGKPAPDKIVRDLSEIHS